MIVSVTFRHIAENNSLRRRVEAGCRELAVIMPDISRASVVFFYEKHHNTSTDLITCHISVRAPHKQHFDVYDHQSCITTVFHRALDRMRSKLTRESAIISRNNHLNNMSLRHDYQIMEGYHHLGP